VRSRPNRHAPRSIRKRSSAYRVLTRRQHSRLSFTEEVSILIVLS
jgi:hypothetical protein